MIPEYEARYVQERRSDADSPLDAACREKQYTAIILVFGVAAVLALAAYDAGHSFSLDRRDAGALSSYFILAVVFFFAFLLFGMRIRQPKKEKVDYSKISYDNKLKTVCRIFFPEGSN
jgi:cytochrome c biogenesis factor